MARTNMDYELMTSECAYFDPPSPDELYRARLQCCANAADATEAEELMFMLGVHPSQKWDPDTLAVMPASLNPVIGLAREAV